jgi:hypothetical protein
MKHLILKLFTKQQIDVNFIFVYNFHIKTERCVWYYSLRETQNALLELI